eukprot:scaffold2881_cov113-Skeletonema_marinoi.AAC.3
MWLETEFERYKALLVVVVSFQLIEISLGRVSDTTCALGSSSSSLDVYPYMNLLVDGNEVLLALPPLHTTSYTKAKHP